jgi:hypothetical protein
MPIVSEQRLGRKGKSRRRQDPASAGHAEQASVEKGKLIDCHDVLVDQSTPRRTNKTKEAASSTEGLVQNVMGLMLEDFAETGLECEKIFVEIEDRFTPKNPPVNPF